MFRSLKRMRDCGAVDTSKPARRASEGFAIIEHPALGRAAG